MTYLIDTENLNPSQVSDVCSIRLLKSITNLMETHDLVQETLCKHGLSENYQTLNIKKHLVSIFEACLKTFPQLTLLEISPNSSSNDSEEASPLPLPTESHQQEFVDSSTTTEICLTDTAILKAFNHPN